MDIKLRLSVTTHKATLNSLLERIEFTTEVVGDFKDDWGLPTLDTMWKLVGEGMEKWGEGIVRSLKKKSEK